MDKNNRTILLVLAVLLVLTSVGAMINQQYANEKAALLEKAEIAVLDNGREVFRLAMGDIKKVQVQEFTANLKSSIMSKPEEHKYTGILLADLFSRAGISLDGRSRVLIRSVDGYTVPLKIEEIEALDNIYLVFKDNGQYLGNYGDKEGQGPYMIVIKGDRFSQRWAKYVCEINVE